VVDDKDREEANGSTPAADDPADQRPLTDQQDQARDGDEQPAEELGGDTDVPDTGAEPSASPASEEGDSSEQELEELQDRSHDADHDPDHDPDGDADGERELVAVGAPSKQRSTSAGNGTGETKSKNAAVARTKKDKATPKQRQVEKKPKRTTPAQFVREAVGELRKVVYPTGSQLANYFVVVLVFVLFIIGIVSLLDLGFGWVIFRVFA
jgi:preprotein translocase subunit SecE